MHVSFTETQALKENRNTRDVLHNYVQLFYLWFPQNIISILLHTMHVIKVQWINFKDEKSKKKRATQKPGGDFDHEERHWLRYCMYNTISFIYRAIDGAINNDVMATVYALRSGEYYCMVVCMCEGKGTYLGTLLRSTTIINFFFFLLSEWWVNAMGGHCLLDIL